MKERETQYPQEYDQGTPCDYAKGTIRNLEYALSNWDTPLPSVWIPIIMEMKNTINNFIDYVEELEG